jgi:hypothetical protein
MEIMRKTQQEILLDLMTELGPKKWWSHKSMLREFKMRVKTPVGSLSHLIKILITQGCIIRAGVPEEIREKNLTANYMYKVTGKPYTHSNFADKIAMKNKFVNANALLQSRELYDRHRKLPLWFRRIMMD